MSMSVIGKPASMVEKAVIKNQPRQRIYHVQTNNIESAAWPWFKSSQANTRYKDALEMPQMDTDPFFKKDIGTSEDEDISPMYYMSLERPILLRTSLEIGQFSQSNHNLPVITTKKPVQDFSSINARNKGKVGQNDLKQAFTAFNEESQSHSLQYNITNRALRPTAKIGFTDLMQFRSSQEEKTQVIAIKPSVKYESALQSNIQSADINGITHAITRSMPSKMNDEILDSNSQNSTKLINQQLDLISFPLEPVDDHDLPMAVENLRITHTLDTYLMRPKNPQSIHESNMPYLRPSSTIGSSSSTSSGTSQSRPRTSVRRCIRQQKVPFPLAAETSDVGAAQDPDQSLMPRGNLQSSLQNRRFEIARNLQQYKNQQNMFRPYITSSPSDQDKHQNSHIAVVNQDFTESESRYNPDMTQNGSEETTSVLESESHDSQLSENEESSEASGSEKHQQMALIHSVSKDSHQLLRKSIGSRSEKYIFEKTQNKSRSGMRFFLQGVRRQNDRSVLLMPCMYSNRIGTLYCPGTIDHHSDTNTILTPFLGETQQRIMYKLPTETNRPYNCLVNSFESAGMRETSTSQWSIYWGFKSLEQIRELSKYQRVAHFAGCWYLGRKDLLYRQYQSKCRQFPKDYNYMPKSYFLDSDYHRFQQIMSSATKEARWILKPAAMACGRGIKVFSRQSKVQLKGKKEYIISDYIANPHLLQGYKYDLRIYVLVTSYDPLLIYVFDEGLVRFATEPYSKKNKDIRHRFCHLTNYSVNKYSQKFIVNKDQSQPNSQTEVDDEQYSKTEEYDLGANWSSKQSLEWYRQQLQKLKIRPESIFPKIHDIIIKTLISVESHMVIAAQPDFQTCFELYGFDILLDKQLNPWLLEVNVCPSLSSSSPLDRRIKHSLIADTVTLLGLYSDQFCRNDNSKVNKVVLPTFASASIEKSVSNLKTSEICNVKKQISINDLSRSIQRKQDDKTVERKPKPIITSEKAKNRVSIKDLSNFTYQQFLTALSAGDRELLGIIYDEENRQGNFKRIFPVSDQNVIQYYSQFFDVKRYRNVLLWKSLAGDKNLLRQYLQASR